MKQTITILFLFMMLPVLAVSENVNFLAAPSNDECSGAIELTVNPNYACSVTESGTLEDATPSSQIVSCIGAASTGNNDVWYKFTATETNHKVQLLNVSGNTNMFHAVYDAGPSATATCSSFGTSPIKCSDPDNNDLTGLTVGNVYYIRVFTKFVGATTTTFDICVGSAPSVPVNDDCASAELITDIENLDMNVDASAATNNSGFINACQPTYTTGMNDGVWYKVEGNNKRVSFTIKPQGWNARIDVYEGSCGSFTCVTSGNAGGNGISEIAIFDAETGKDYYINVGFASGTSDQPEGVFNIKGDEILTLSLDNLTKKGFVYYPNPTNGDLFLQANEAIKDVRVYNYIGKEVINLKSIDSKVPMSHLAGGTYFVRVTVGDATGSFKVIKK